MITYNATTRTGRLGLERDGDWEKKARARAAQKKGEQGGRRTADAEKKVLATKTGAGGDDGKKIKGNIVHKMKTYNTEAERKAELEWDCGLDWKRRAGAAHKTKKGGEDSPRHRQRGDDRRTREETETETVATKARGNARGGCKEEA